MAECARETTVKWRVPPKTPALDMKQLNLRAARRWIQRRAERSKRVEDWMMYNNLDVVCRHHAHHRMRRKLIQPLPLLRSAAQQPARLTGVWVDAATVGPMLSNLALARIVDYLPHDLENTVRMVIYADDVNLFASGPISRGKQVRQRIKRSLEAVDAFISSIGLLISTTKTEALLVYPTLRARYEVGPHVLWTRSAMATISALPRNHAGSLPELEASSCQPPTQLSQLQERLPLSSRGAKAVRLTSP
ncbi:hypothetical protein HPB51_004824 [Rhipicephalus microplus]|uniref:Uncharacterized protein n=1 Tax=Rhipicephalus microplus TaxID=6941 RepID=A0A9J6EXP4_RHIMP|nr:hypothetical protein HPB51_004824 [Rhipicephalus microplus]